MHIQKIYILSVIFLLISVSLKSQISGFNNGPKTNIETGFLLPKIEVEAKKSFFNILKIKNNSVQSFRGRVSLTSPDKWKVIGEETISLNIQPGDSTNIPIRVIVSKDVVGEVAYVIVASIFDNNDSPLKSEYCFVTIPRKSDTKVKLLKNISYFNSKTGKAEIQYKIQNNGNINELVHIELKGKDDLLINEVRHSENKPYVDEISLGSHSDTTLIYSMQLLDEDDDRTFYSVYIHASTPDTTYKHTAWLNKVDYKYDLMIPSGNKCAIVELTATNIFSNVSPSFNLLVMGTVLFKKQTDVYYYFNNTNLSNYPSQRFNDETRFYVGMENRYSHIRVGNIDKKFEQIAYGRGFEATLKSRQSSIEGFYIDGIFENSLFYGGEFNQRFKKFNLKAGYAQIINEDFGQTTDIGVFASNFNVAKTNISLWVSGSKAKHTLITPFERIGYGLKAGLYKKINRLSINLRVNYGSPEYPGLLNGRTNASGIIKYKFADNSFFKFDYIKKDFSPILYQNDVVQPRRYKYFDKYRLSHRKFITNYLNIEYGSELFHEKTNQVYSTPNSYFETINPRVFLASQIRISNSKLIINPKIDFGNITVMQAEGLDLALNKSYYTVNALFNLTFKNAGLFIQYRNGPYSVYEQFYFYGNNYFSRWLFIMPFYEKFIIKNKLQFMVRASYQSNLNNNQNNFVLTTQLKWHLPRDWTVRLLNSTATRTRKDAVNNATLRYNSTYFELGVRKEFNCNQPRIKYYDLKIIFFRDLNGNRIKDKNEPGLNNVLGSIDKNHIDSAYQTRADEFVSTELLSNQNGLIEYNNIPDGSYKLKYLFLGEAIGNFSREELNEEFIIDEDKTIFIPLLENNKIFGQVILNRNPLSNLGPMDKANIRITAEDTKGHIFSALTDKNGNFVLYTPVADHYIVKINNIFYESFDLQQDEYIVKFNGYKQFRVSFIFNEKKRKINFDNDLNTDDDFKDDDILAIRKTTLSGKIRDAISLEPIGSTIKIIDNTTNRVVAEAVSNKLNGNYSISYVAGDKFRIEVKAEGHWEHVENLYIEQVISIQNIAKDIMLNKLSDGPKKQTFIIYDEKEEEQFTQNFKPGQKIPMNKLNFKEKETRLSPNVYPELDRLIDLLNKNKAVKVEIAGFADDSGKDRIDNLLALRRAKAVARYLTSHGLSEDRIVVKSYSNKRPLVPGDSEKAKQKNRRVEIIVL